MKEVEEEEEEEETKPSHYSILFYSILFYSRLCPFIAESVPPLESFSFLCPLLSLSRLFSVATQGHLSNDVLVFQPISRPVLSTIVDH